MQYFKNKTLGINLVREIKDPFGDHSKHCRNKSKKWKADRFILDRTNTGKRAALLNAICRFSIVPPIIPTIFFTGI